MSTASQHCGSAGGSRAGNRNAVSVPGVEAKTRGHYDPRAQNEQLGSPDVWTGPKCFAKDVNAAPPGNGLRQPDHQRREATPCRPCMSWAHRAKTFPIGLREPRLRHSPPAFLARPPPEQARPIQRSALPSPATGGRRLAAGRMRAPCHKA